MSEWQIPLCRPVLGRAEEWAVLEVLRSGDLANGPRADLFAARVAEEHGAQHSCAVSSGTLGLELALRAIGIGRGHNVLCPAYTFVASANAILATGALPQFVDVDECGMMSLYGLRDDWLRWAKAAVVVDLFGQSADEQVQRLRKLGIPVVEDACEALGGVAIGGDVGVFGFFPNKQITTCEGGVVCANGWRGKQIVDRVRAMRNHGRGPDGRIVGWGTNARMSEVHAALGLAQLSRMDESIYRRWVAAVEWYDPELRRCGVRTLADHPLSWFVYPVWFASRKVRDAVRAKLNDAGIQTGDYFPYIPTMPQFGNRDRHDHPQAWKLAQTGLALPFHPQIRHREVREVCRIVREVVG